MTKNELIKTLKDDLEVQKEIVALKAVTKPPPIFPHTRDRLSRACVPSSVKSYRKGPCGM